MKVLFLFLFYSGLTHATGLHLMAGGGINSSSYNTSGQGVRVGAGLNFKTDLGYYFNNQWAVEWSSQVKFNRVANLFIWDTLMTVGPRYQFKRSPYYTRAFIGRSPTVIFLDDAPEVTRDTNASRLQYDGLVYGAGFGKLYEAEDKKVFFYECALSYQRLEEETGIRNDGEVPVETFSRKANADIHIFSLYATIGVRIF